MGAFTAGMYRHLRAAVGTRPPETSAEIQARERQTREAELVRCRHEAERETQARVARRREAEAEAERAEAERRRRAGEAFQETVRQARCVFPGEYYGPMERDRLGGLRRSWRDPIVQFISRLRENFSR
jgi:hypothetical protein